MLGQIKPINYFPPRLQFFRPEHTEPFKELDKVNLSLNFFPAGEENLSVVVSLDFPPFFSKN